MRYELAYYVYKSTGSLIKYNDKFYRDDVMTILQAIDPEGVAVRSARRLRRRIYSCKVVILVIFYSVVFCSDIEHFRD